MVLENLFDSNYLNKHKPMIFLISLAYTIIGIGISFLLFREFNESIVALAIISLMILVTFKDILKISSDPHHDENNKKITILNLIKEYKNSLIIFLYIFAGVMIGFSIFSMIVPNYATEYVFNSQYNLLVTENAEEIFSFGDFQSIFFNNFTVLLVSLIISFLFGIGTIFLFIVVWNASVIGVVFGTVAKQTALIINLSSYEIFFIILIASLPHIFFEITSYLISGIIGENFSNFVLYNKRKKFFNLKIFNINLSLFKEKEFSPKKLINFNLSLLLFAVFLLIIAVILEVNFSHFFINLFI